MAYREIGYSVSKERAATEWSEIGSPSLARLRLSEVQRLVEDVVELNNGLEASVGQRRYACGGAWCPPGML